MIYRHRKSIPNILAIPQIQRHPFVKFDKPSDPGEDFKILADYANELYRENKITKELYDEFINYIATLCLEKMIESKFNEIIPRWNKRFDSWFNPNIEESP